MPLNKIITSMQDSTVVTAGVSHPFNGLAAVGGKAVQLPTDFDITTLGSAGYPSGTYDLHLTLSQQGLPMSVAGNTWYYLEYTQHSNNITATTGTNLWSTVTATDFNSNNTFTARWSGNTWFPFVNTNGNATAFPAVTTRSNGSQTLPSGIIIKWGNVVTGTVLSTEVADVVFSPAFPTTCLNVTASVGVSTANYNQVTAYRTDRQAVSVGLSDAIGFHAQIFKDNRPGDSRMMQWLAIGV